MRTLAIRLLTLAIYATASVVVPMVTPTKAEAGGRHAKHKRHWSRSFGDPWSAGRTPPVAALPNQTREVCPGLARSFDCAVWPPPMNDDPDRKASKY
jgi:hypothetical protein